MEKVKQFEGYILTNDEAEQLTNLLLTIRKEKEKQRLIQKAKTAISLEMNNAINTIGLEETKRIMRELTRGLRNGLVQTNPFLTGPKICTNERPHICLFCILQF